VIRKYVNSSFSYIDRPVIPPLDTDIPIRIKLYPFLIENARMTGKRRKLYIFLTKAGHFNPVWVSDPVWMDAVRNTLPLPGINS
jgi:hypothetical protein